jgi:hypothetical protein
MVRLSLRLLFIGALTIGYATSASAQITTTWNGAASDFDWNNAANWDNGVPTFNDHAVINISGGFNPLLAADIAVNNLTVNAGATLAASGQQITVNGNLTVTTSDDPGDGLVLSDPADEVIVEGNAVFTTSVNDANAFSTGNYTDGVIKFRGNFTQTRNGSGANTGSFISTGTLVVFDGSGSQSVDFAFPNLTQSYLQDVDIINPVGVTFTSHVYFTGQLTLASGSILNQTGSPSVFVTQSLPIVPSDATYNVANTRIAGDITMLAPLTLPAVVSDLFVEPGFQLVVNGNRLEVGDKLFVTTSNIPGDGLIMQNAADEVVVNGDALFTTSPSHATAFSTGNYADGILRIRGDFTQTRNGGISNPGSFISTGTTVIFEAAGPQTVQFDFPGLSQSYLEDATIASGAVVTFTNHVVFTGRLTLESGADLNQSGSPAVQVSQLLPDVPSDAFYDVVTTRIIGTVTMDRPATFSNPISDVTIDPGSMLVINGHRLEMGGDLTVTTSNVAGDGLIIQNPSDEVVVGGNALFTTSPSQANAFSTGNFSDGVIRIGGDFTQTRNGSTSSTGSFVSTGTEVVFDGTATQTINFAFPAVNQSLFHDLSLENNGPGLIRFTSDIVASGQLRSSLDNFPEVEGNSNTLTVNGGLNVNGLGLDKVALQVNGGPFDAFDFVSFRNYSTAATQMFITHTDVDAAFVGVEFEVAPSTGKYISATDTDGGTAARITMINANPTDGSGNTITAGGFLVDWTTELYAIDDEATTDEEKPVTIGVIDNDLNPNEAPITVTAVSTAANGLVVIDTGALTVTYTPAEDFIGSDSFTYTVDDPIGESVDVATVSVTVTPDFLDPVISATPSPLDFGGVLEDETVEVVVTIENTGDDNLIVTDVSTEEPFATSAAPFVLAPDATQDVTVSFTPPFLDAFDGELSFTSNDPVNPTFSVDLSGDGITNGDIGGDGNVNILDVIALVGIILGDRVEPPAESQTFLAADLNADGDLNVLDVIALINVILFELDKPTAPPAIAIISFGAPETDKIGARRIPLTLETDAAIAGLQLDLRYDPSSMDLTGLLPAERMADMHVKWQDLGGTVRLLIYGGPGQTLAPGNDPLFYLPVEMISDMGEITIEAFLAGDLRAQALNSEIGTGAMRLATLPTAFALNPNRPNPFNPSTVIAYEVPQSAVVRLTVYNVLGQEVARLVDGQHAAGRYEVRWDGANARGHSVASGVYLYRLTSSTGWGDVRRMLLVK